MIQSHLATIERYLLINTDLFPSEWKNIAYKLQYQRVPEEWEKSEKNHSSINMLEHWIDGRFFTFSNENLTVTNRRFSLKDKMVVTLS
jgi:hypothetical protein